MTLPATWNEAIEAEGLAFSRDLIKRQRVPGGIFHPDAEIIFGRRLMKEYALQSAQGADEVVYLAENGSVEADAALQEIITELVDRNESLGVVFGAYEIRSRRHLPRPSGPPKAGNFVRDIAITLLVSALVDRFNLRPNLRTAARGPTASSVAAAALTEAGIASLGPKGVEKIWRRTASHGHRAEGRARP
jgi:hypothetical protein